MIDQTQFDEIQALIAADCFFDEICRDVYGVLVDLFSAGKPVDLVIVSDELRARDMFDRIGGNLKLVDLAESFGAHCRVVEYAEIVAGLAHRRALIGNASRLRVDAFDLSKDPVETANTFGRAITDTAMRVTVRDAIRPIGDHIRSFRETILEGAQEHIATGLESFDHAIGGIERGALTILAARPSVGKTALAMQISVNAAKAGSPVLFVSAEMGSNALVKRYLGSVLGVDGPTACERLRNAPDETLRASDDAIGDGQLFLTDELRRLPDIVAAARTYVRRHGVALICVDYLQLLDSGGKSENRNLAVAAMTSAMKALAIGSGAAVLLLSQLSRESSRQGRKPSLFDLRDSGAIEQDADVVLALQRGDCDASMANVGVLLEVLKNRNGPLGTFALEFNRPTMTFRSAPRMAPAS